MTREQAIACAERLFGGYATLKPSEANVQAYADMFERFDAITGQEIVNTLHAESDTCPSAGQVYACHARLCTGYRDL